MKLIFKLAISNLRVLRVRVALTLAAIALSVSLVVSVTSGYTSAQAAAHKGLATFLGSTDATITRGHDLRGGISSSVIDQFASDPDVRRASGRLELGSTLLKSDGTPAGGLAQIIGLDDPSADNVQGMRMEQGEWFSADAPTDVVVDQVALERLGAKLGDELILPSVDRQLHLHIVGVVHKPTILAAAMQTVYVPLATLQKFMLPDQPPQVSRILVELRTGADPQAFYDRWAGKLTSIEPDLRMKLASQSHRDMDKNLQGIEALSYMGGSVAMLAAMFIIFSALSMGVAERQRTLAMLRAVGAVRSQLGWLVVTEGMLLATAGIVLGIPLGILWIHVLTWKYSLLFVAGAVVSVNGTIYGALGSLASALAASLLPAVAAMRASPLEAMSPLAKPPRAGGVFICAIIGLVLLCLDPIILWGLHSRDVQFYGHFAVGVPATMIGWFLIGPMLVIAIAKVLGPLVARALGLRAILLQHQLSGGAWRSAGAAAALMVGLAILIVTQTQGTTAILGWKLPDKFPDVFIYSYLGLTPADQEKLAKLPEIQPGQLAPIAIASPDFGVSLFGIAGAAVMPDATMFFGIEPDKTLDMLDLDWRQGSAAEAKELLKLGRHIIVSQEFKLVKNLNKGDKLSLKTNQGVVDFEIAGVVWSPGIDVITSTQDLATQFDQRTAASVFGSLDDAKKYFGVERIRLFAANLVSGVEKKQLLEQLKKDLGNRGLEAGDVRQIKFAIQQVFKHLLMLVSSIAFAALAVASVGVTNTIMASVRSRRWHLGVLRSIGTTRGQVMRLVLAESILLGIAGVVLGLAAGTQLAIDAHHGWGVFIGYEPPLVVPWDAVIIGIGSVMLVAILASLWPAAHAARSQPLTLLAAGRAAM